MTFLEGFVIILSSAAVLAIVLALFTTYNVRANRREVAELTREMREERRSGGPPDPRRTP